MSFHRKLFEFENNAEVFLAQNYKKVENNSIIVKKNNVILSLYEGKDYKNIYFYDLINPDKSFAVSYDANNTLKFLENTYILIGKSDYTYYHGQYLALLNPSESNEKNYTSYNSLYITKQYSHIDFTDMKNTILYYSTLNTRLINNHLTYSPIQKVLINKNSNELSIICNLNISEYALVKHNLDKDFLGNYIKPTYTCFDLLSKDIEKMKDFLLLFNDVTTSLFYMNFENENKAINDLKSIHFPKFFPKEYIDNVRLNIQNDLIEKKHVFSLSINKVENNLEESIQKCLNFSDNYKLALFNLKKDSKKNKHILNI